MLFTAFTFTSCDKLADEIEDSVEVTINTSFEAPFVATPVSEKANADGNTEFKEIVIIDPSENDDLADYLEKIQSVEITGINLLVTSISDPSIVLNSGVFSITDNVNGSTFVYNTPQDTPISKGSTFAIGELNPGWDTINQIVEDMNASTLTAIGSINQDDFEIGFVYSISVKVVAKP